MATTRSTGRSWLHKATLLLLAGSMAAVFYAIDLHVPAHVAFGAVYCLLVLYSWLLPGARAPMYTGLLCWMLIIADALFSTASTSADLASRIGGLNRIVSLIVVGVCSALVAIVRGSFERLERAKQDLELQVEERTRELAERLEELKRNNYELEQFAYIASHDLQEPLRTISTCSGMLLREYTPREATAQRLLSFLAGSSERASSLLKDMLAYSRLGKQLTLTRVDCQALLESVQADLGTALAESQARIEVPTPLPRIQGYETELRQLWQNLVENALKFQRPDTQPLVQIRFQEAPDEFRFSVQDNGIGIAPEHRERIFRIFQRLHTQSEFAGTGIGLAQCQKVAELHGGRIWVESELGVGSCFRFTIPKKLAMAKAS